MQMQIDTDAISNIFKKRPAPNLVRHLQEVPPDAQFITTITVAEIVYGVKKSKRPEYHLNNLRQLLLKEIAVLDFDLPAAYLAGQIRAHLERAGTRLAWPDIQIAAIALVHELLLITGKTRHFARIPGLRVENWLDS